MMKVKPVKLGKTERMSFSHIDEVISMPNLIEVQKNSYQWFLDEGLKEVFHDIGTIEDYTGNLALSFVDFRLDKEPKYSIKECKERDVTYAAPLRVTARLLNKETGEVKDQEIFMGDFPLMTDAGTFVINGAERAIVSQLVRSPGVFYGDAKDKVGNDLYSATMNPNRGAWLEYETDASNVFYVRIDKNRKLPVTVLCRALGLSSDEEILNFFGEDERILATLEKDTTKNQDEGLLEVYRKLRPGEPPTVESATNQINMLFFDPRRYDLSRFGRYKMNKKLSLARRITGFVAAENIVAPLTGEIIVEAKDKITRELAKMKQIPVPELIEGKKLLFVDDSIVRGTQLRETVEFLYESGAEEVHMRSACPPIMHSCKYLNFSRGNSDMDLLARRTIQELEGDEGQQHLEEYADVHTERGQCMLKAICEKLGFDSLGYQSLEGLLESIGLDRDKVCTYCWNGRE